jgi:aminoglycoside 6'-N-acetyltransferase I
LTGPVQPVRLHIRQVTQDDAAVWEAMRRELWPDGADDHAPEIADYFAGKLCEPVAVLLAETPAKAVLGFAELSIRTDIPGFEGKRVGYVEGLFVTPAVRHQGIAHQLLRASQAWARDQQCAAFASDRAGRLVLDASFLR